MPSPSASSRHAKPSKTAAASVKKAARPAPKGKGAPGASVDARTGKAAPSSAKKAKKLPPIVREFFSDKEQKAIEETVLAGDGAAPIVSRFGMEFHDLVQRTGADAGKLESDALTAAMYRATLGMVLDLIPIAENTYRTKMTEQSAYALNALINQAVSVSGLLRGFNDMQERASFISESILLPAFVRITQQMLAASTGLHAAIDGSGLKPEKASEVKKAVSVMVKEFAAYLHGESTAVTAIVTDFLTQGAQVANAPLSGPGSGSAKPAKKAPAKAKKPADGGKPKRKAPKKNNGSARKQRDEGSFDPSSMM